MHPHIPGDSSSVSGKGQLADPTLGLTSSVSSPSEYHPLEDESAMNYPDVQSDDRLHLGPMLTGTVALKWSPRTGQSDKV